MQADIKTHKEENYKIPEKWDDKDLPEFVYHDEVKKSMNFSTKFFLISSGVFFLVLSFVLYSFFHSSSVFSANNIDFVMNGSNSLPSGEPGSLSLNVSNKNKVSLINAYILVQYDSGENLSGAKNIVSQKIDIGEILPNDTSEKSVSVTLFGKEGSQKEIDATLFYKISGSNAEFNKLGNPVGILLKSSPVTITVDSLDEFHQANLNTFNLTIKNNTPKDIKNLIVSVRPPLDFVYSSSSQALYNNNPSWLIKNLSANSENKISFSGKLTGNIGVRDHFSFFAGTPNSSNSSTSASSTLGNYDNFNLSLDNIYSQAEKDILVSGQYLDVAITSDSSAGSATVSPNDLLMLDFTYKNNLNYPIDNVVFTAKLLGNGIDNTYTEPIQGTYDQSLSVATWDKTTFADLSQIPANGTGKFTFKIKVARNMIGDNTIHLQLSTHGERKSEKNVSNDQNMSLERTWTLKSN
ncbi:MAG: hypothetical protein WCO35_02270 [Candidatus Nomurabacteria bacterium]